MAATGMAGHSLARPGTEDRDFVGVTYDPYTHQLQGKATVQFRPDGETLDGQLSAAGFDVSFEDLNAYTSQRGFTQYTGIADDDEFVQDDLPLKYKLTDTGHNVVGHLTRPSPHYRKIGLTVIDRESGGTFERAKRGLTGQGDGKPDVEPRDLPASGIPEQQHPADLSGGDR